MTLIKSSAHAQSRALQKFWRGRCGSDNRIAHADGCLDAGRPRLRSSAMRSTPWRQGSPAPLAGFRGSG